MSDQEIESAGSPEESKEAKFKRLAEFRVNNALAKIALIGNEAAAAGKQRGSDFKARTELSYQQDRLRAVFDQEACGPAIDQLIRTLDLPLQDRVVTAAVNRTP